MKFIPEDVVNRLENEWRQIQVATSAAPDAFKAAAAEVMQAGDRGRSVASAVPTAGFARKL